MKRLLRRFADASLRTENAKLTYARDQAREVAKRLHRRLQAERATSATNQALMERWKGIALYAQEQLAEERAPKETTK